MNIKNLSDDDLNKLDAIGRIAVLSYWVEKSGITLDNALFSFRDHEYLLGIYQDSSPVKVFKKGAQMGFSTFEMLSAIHGCEYTYPTGVLHLFPTKDDVTDFSKSKYAKLIDQNPETIGAFLAHTDQSNIKRIGDAFLYLRGSRSRTQLKSISVDKIIFDEYDEMRVGASSTGSGHVIQFDPISLARERYSHSDFKHEDILSTPTLPDFGIEKEFSTTDQKHWYIQCEHCKKFTCLELTFPECLQPQKDGSVIRACKHCKKKIDPSNGLWDAHYKSITDRSGYYISQLCSKVIAPETIYNQYMNLNTMTAHQRTEFWNSKLGMGYVEIQDRLTKQQILELCDPVPMVSAHLGNQEGICTMGVDQGNQLHVVIGKRTGENTKKILHIGNYDEWHELDDLMQSFNIWRCVVDALPEQRNARAFANRHPGKVYLNYYNYRQKGTVKWNYAEFRVEENRTESLDESHNMIMYGYLSLPRHSDIVEEFAKHCTNIAKRLEEDPETGSKEYNYLKLGADHYRHALNYFNIACLEAPVSTQNNDDYPLEGFRMNGFSPIRGKEEILCNTYH